MGLGKCAASSRCSTTHTAEDLVLTALWLSGLDIQIQHGGVMTLCAFLDEHTCVRACHVQDSWGQVA